MPLLIEFTSLQKRLLIAIILGFLSLRLGLSLLYPLSADEAHYALYALHLDLSYFDHPPLIGWLQAVVLLFNDSDWALRLLPNLLNLISAIGLILLCHALFGPNIKIILWTVFLYQINLLVILISTGFIPESLLVTLSIYTALVTVRLAEQPTRNKWLLLGALLGLLGLSKYTAILIAVGVGMYLTKKSIRWWRSMDFYWALTLALIIISPVLVWNFQNDFISFGFQLEHGKVGAGGIDWQAFLQNQIIQMILYSPLVFSATWLMAVRAFRHNTTSEQLLSMLSLPTLLVFAYSSAKGGHYLPHWTAVPMVLCLPQLAYWMVNKWTSQWRLLFVANLSYSIVGLCLLVAAFAGQLPQRANQIIFADVHGWKETATLSKKLAKNFAADQQVIYVANKWDASRIAWYARPIPLVSLDPRPSQFDFWANKDDYQSGGLLITSDTDLAPLNNFQQCILQQKVNIQSQLGKRLFNLYYCTHLKP